MCQKNLNEAEKPKILTAADLRDRAMFFFFFLTPLFRLASEAEGRLHEELSRNVGRAI